MLLRPPEVVANRRPIRVLLAEPIKERFDRGCGDLPLHAHQPVARPLFEVLDLAQSALHLLLQRLPLLVDRIALRLGQRLVLFGGQRLPLLHRREQQTVILARERKALFSHARF